MSILSLLNERKYTVYMYVLGESTCIDSEQLHGDGPIKYVCTCMLCSGVLVVHKRAVQVKNWPGSSYCVLGKLAHCTLTVSVFTTCRCIHVGLPLNLMLKVM